MHSPQELSDSARLCESARQFATVRNVLTAKVVAILRQRTAALISDRELEAIATQWFETVTDDMNDAEMLKRMAECFDEIAIIFKKLEEATNRTVIEVASNK